MGQRSVESLTHCATVRFRLFVAGAVFCITSALGGSLNAQSPAVMLTGSPAPLAVRDAVAGAAPQADSDATGRLTLVAVASATRLYVHSDTPLPPDVTLRVRVEAPAGALAMGFVTVDDAPQELITGIAEGTYTALTITYELSATTLAGAIALSTCNVVFTISDGPV